MSIERDYDLILTIVNRGYADDVISAARSAGARGGTVFYARGTGAHDIEKFFSITIQPEKEVVLNIVNHNQTQKIISEIVKKAGLKSEGRGMCIALPVSEAIGLIPTDVQEEDHSS